MAKSIEVEIQWQGRPEKVVMRRLTFGEKNKLAEESTNIKIIGGMPHTTVSISAMKELGVLKGLVTAPFPINLESVRQLDPEIGERLFEEFQKLNDLEEKKGGTLSS